MKQQRRNTKQIQTRLFYETELSRDPISLDLPTDREAELKVVIGELLLNVALDNAEAPRGAAYDEQADT